jgi:histone-binding protein RBBP4
MTHGEEDDQTERLINEGQKRPSLYTLSHADRLLEYKTWKKNSPFLYDMILGYVSFALDSACV